LIFCEFFLHILPIFWLNGKPDTKESKKKKGGSKTNKRREGGAREGMGARCRRTGFRRDSENLHVGQRH
jgi:hypothetical protein